MTGVGDQRNDGDGRPREWREVIPSSWILCRHLESYVVILNPTSSSWILRRHPELDSGSQVLCSRFRIKWPTEWQGWVTNGMTGMGDQRNDRGGWPTEWRGWVTKGMTESNTIILKPIPSSWILYRHPEPYTVILNLIQDLKFYAQDSVLSDQRNDRGGWPTEWRGWVTNGMTESNTIILNPIPSSWTLYRHPELDSGSQVLCSRFRIKWPTEWRGWVANGMTLYSRQVF